MPKINKKILISMLAISIIISGFSTITASDCQSGGSVIDVEGNVILVVNHPSEVNEMATFQVQTNVEADITFNGLIKTGKSVSFQAPLTYGEDQIYNIFAEYCGDKTIWTVSQIIIKDYLELYISSVNPSTVVEEGGTIKVTVKDQNNNGLVGALVGLIGYTSAVTGFGGVATLTAPSVDSDKLIEIVVEKEGYDLTDGSKYITVKNLELYFSEVESEIDENEYITGKVLDQNGFPVNKANINFGGNEASTNSNGYFSVQAPLVTDDELVALTATKKKNGIDYDSANQEIYVKDVFENIAVVKCIVKNANGSNMEDALVEFIVGGNQQAQTDENGTCVFTVEPKQSGQFYTLKISSSGYRTQYKSFTAYVTDYFEWTFNLVLSLDVESVEGETSQQTTPSSQQTTVFQQFKQLIQNIIINIKQRHQTTNI